MDESQKKHETFRLLVESSLQKDSSVLVTPSTLSEESFLDIPLSDCDLGYIVQVLFKVIAQHNRLIKDKLYIISFITPFL